MHLGDLISRGGYCDRSKVFLSWGKRLLLYWQKLSAASVQALAEAPQASCPVIPTPTPSFAWVVQLFTGSLVSEVKKFISAEKTGGGIIFDLDQFPD